MNFALKKLGKRQNKIKIELCLVVIRDIRHNKIQKEE